jgi:hypothetical protein
VQASLLPKYFGNRGKLSDEQWGSWVTEENLDSRLIELLWFDDVQSPWHVEQPCLLVYYEEKASFPLYKRNLWRGKIF